jgi:hypothetical protein
MSSLLIVTKQIYMMNLYFENMPNKTGSALLEPKKETIQFLLDYSKSIRIVKVKTNYFIKLHLN